MYMKLLSIPLALLLLAGCNDNDKVAVSANAAEPVSAAAPAHDHNAPGHTHDEPGEAPAADSLPANEQELVGQAAPDFTLPDMDGNAVSLSDFAGKIVVLDWYNCECPVVKAYYNDEAFMATMNEALGGKDDVVWLSVVSSAPGKQGHDPEVIKSSAPGFGKVNVTLRDESGQVGKAYGATATPTAYVIGTDGTVLYAGSFDEAANPQEAPKGTNFTLAAVEAARAGNAPAVTDHPAFGCSVKY